jgi:hypothetical protein
MSVVDGDCPSGYAKANILAEETGAILEILHFG